MNLKSAFTLYKNTVYFYNKEPLNPYTIRLYV